MIFIPQEGFLMQEATQSWYFYFLMILLSGYALARASLGRLADTTLMAAIRFSSASSLFKDNSQLQRQRDNLLNTFYFLSVGFFSMLLMQKYDIKPYNLSDYKLFIFNTAVLFFFFLLRIILVNAVAVVFSSRDLFREYLYQGFSYNKLMGIAFLPLNFVIIFSAGHLQNISFYLSLGIMGILIFLKIFRGFVFSIRNRVFNFYLFLYLCALEIVPLLLLYKWFSIIV